MTHNTPTKQLEQLIQLQSLLSEFAAIKRVVLHKHGEAENDPEHSYTLALAAWFLTHEDDNLDTDTCIRYALVHDLIEVFAGDTDVFDDTDIMKSKAKREAAAIQKLSDEYPSFNEFVEYIKRYEERADEESRFVYALDKIMPIILTYTADGMGWKKHSKSIRLADLRAVKDDKVKIHPKVNQIYVELVAVLDAHPELFC